MSQDIGDIGQRVVMVWVITSATSVTNVLKHHAVARSPTVAVSKS